MEHGFVRVRFEQSNGDYYFKNTLKDLAPDDYVVVDTARGLQVVQVLDFPENVERHVGRWTIDKVDMTAFTNIQKIRQREKENKVRRSELKREMKALYNKEVVPDLYEKFAENNQAMAALLSEYKALK